jgi:hypothetical protein
MLEDISNVQIRVSCAIELLLSVVQDGLDVTLVREILQHLYWFHSDVEIPVAKSICLLGCVYLNSLRKVIDL